MGGCSNREISLRALENNLTDSYDFCIIQWTSLHRLWLYESSDNIDNETQILPRVTGWGDLSAAALLSKIMISNYLNDYMAIKHWFLDQIMLQTFFEKNAIRYVFLRGFPNHCPEIEKLSAQTPFSSISEIDIPNSIKKILNFDNLPDDYLYDKLTLLIKLYQLIDKTNCIGYNVNSTRYGLSEHLDDDVADDGMHPGKITNQLISNHILKHCETKGIGS